MSGAPEGRVGVLVLGMHRSGTSALTRAMALCGAALPARLMAPGADNAAGFWEPAAIVALHEAMLREAGRRWDDGQRLDVSRVADRGAALAAALREDFAEAPLLVLKDPRLSRLLLLWRPVLAQAGLSPRVVVALRHPMAIAASLRARDGMSESRALLLGLRYFLDAERNSRGITRVFARYEALLADPVSCLTEIGARLGVDWPVPPAAARADLREFVAPGLRHHDEAAAFPAGVVGEAAAAAWAWATAAAEAGEPEGAVLDGIAARLDAAEAWLGGVLDEWRARDEAAARTIQALRERCAAAEQVGAVRRLWRRSWAALTR